MSNNKRQDGVSSVQSIQNCFIILWQNEKKRYKKVFMYKLIIQFFMHMSNP